MAFSFKQVGMTIQQVQKQLKRLEKEHVKQVAAAIRPNFREAVKFARARIRVLFKGRGKRLARAFVSEIRTRPDNLIARLGYVKPRGKTGARRFWFLGRFYEQRSNIQIQAKKGHLWIPIGNNRSGSGAPIVSAQDFFSTMQGRSVVKMSSRGNLIAFGSDGRDLVPMFVLKKSVTIQSRPVLKGVTDKYLPIIRRDAGTNLMQNFRR